MIHSRGDHSNEKRPGKVIPFRGVKPAAFRPTYQVRAKSGLDDGRKIAVKTEGIKAFAAAAASTGRGCDIITPARETDEAEAIAEGLEAVFLDADDEAGAASTPHTVKRGVVSPNRLKLKGPQESAPLSGIEWKTARKDKAPDALAEVFAAFRFDWVQGVIPNEEGGGDCVVGGPVERDAVARAIRFFERIGLRLGEPGRGGTGYETALPFFEGTSKEKVGSIASGSRTGGMPNITLSGGRGFCAVAGPLMLREFEGLRISRVDACLDVSAPDAFEALREAAVKFCRARRMPAPEVRGTETPEKGLTVYIGSKQSEVRARIYTKGLQLIAAGETDTDPDWVRIEFEFKNLPSAKKAGFGRLTPGEMVRAYVWPRQFIALAANVIGLTDAVRRAERSKVQQEERMKDLHTTAAHGAEQYAKTFLRIAAQEIAAERCGGDMSALEIDEVELARKAAAVFLRAIRETDKTAKVIEADRLAVKETPARRAQMVADRQQANRLRELDRRQRAFRRTALVVAEASKDADARAAAAQAAAHYEAEAYTAAADVFDIRADAHKRRADFETAEAEVAAAEVLAAFAAAADAHAIRTPLH